MMTIYKYPLIVTDLQDVAMPRGAHVMSAGRDPAGELCLWAAVDPDAPSEPVDVRIVGTGNPFPAEALQMMFVGTVVDTPFVWHVFVG